jgi:hypothetical protein
MRDRLEDVKERVYDAVDPSRALRQDDKVVTQQHEQMCVVVERSLSRSVIGGVKRQIGFVELGSCLCQLTSPIAAERRKIKAVSPGLN